MNAEEGKEKKKKKRKKKKKKKKKIFVTVLIFIGNGAVWSPSPSSSSSSTAAAAAGGEKGENALAFGIRDIRWLVGNCYPVAEEGEDEDEEKGEITPATAPITSTDGSGDVAVVVLQPWKALIGCVEG